MGMDLGGIGHAIGRDAERFDRPVQVVRPLGAAQRQAFAQRRFVDLDHLHAGPFQVQHLVADRQRQLAAAHGARLVVAHE